MLGGKPERISINTNGVEAHWYYSKTGYQTKSFYYTFPKYDGVE